MDFSSGSTRAGLADPDRSGPRRPLKIWMDAPGGVLKRSTRADCKSAGYAYVGSNPTPSTRYLWRRTEANKSIAGLHCFVRPTVCSERDGRETRSEPCAKLGWQRAEGKKKRQIHTSGRFDTRRLSGFLHVGKTYAVRIRAGIARLNEDAFFELRV